MNNARTRADRVRRCGRPAEPVLGAPPTSARRPGPRRPPAGYPHTMADEGDVLTDLNLDPGLRRGQWRNGADTQPVAGIISQYVKDLSVENPNAPAASSGSRPPQIDVQFNIGAQQIERRSPRGRAEDRGHRQSGRGRPFLIELAYCGLVGMRNMPDEQAHAFLYAEAPRILFPFARRVIADAVRDAGLPPLMLDPIDFNGLYLQQLAAPRGPRKPLPPAALRRRWARPDPRCTARPRTMIEGAGTFDEPRPQRRHDRRADRDQPRVRLRARHAARPRARRGAGGRRLPARLHPAQHLPPAVRRGRVLASPSCRCIRAQLHGERRRGGGGRAFAGDVLAVFVWVLLGFTRAA